MVARFTVASTAGRKIFTEKTQKCQVDKGRCGTLVKEFVLVKLLRSLRICRSVPTASKLTHHVGQGHPQGLRRDRPNRTNRLMRIEHEPDMPGLRRDWLGARVIGGLGVVVLLTAAALTIAGLWRGYPPAPISSTAPPAVSTAAPSDTVVVPATSAADARRQENIALCTAALLRRNARALFPVSRRRRRLQNTDVQGRYICLAKTDAARYSIGSTRPAPA